MSKLLIKIPAINSILRGLPNNKESMGRITAAYKDARKSTLKKMPEMRQTVFNLTDLKDIGEGGAFEIATSLGAFLDSLTDEQREQLGREVWGDR